ncbi:deoxyuridine 5'-triphosphate nucleotidohydrolase [Bacillus phage vB_BceH_LY2]|nr:deoxyuridine 5'-triphosphate nucleotidohydrolase [Bacillus phage vB_BceH_LY2]
MSDELKVVEELEVLYKLEGGQVPNNAHGDDFCEDVYASEGRLIPPGTFKSVLVPTGIKTAFDTKYGMKLNTRSGSGYHTPLILSNATGIIEGTYRGTIGVLLRNTYMDSSTVDFVFTTKGERVPLSEVPKEDLYNARKFFEEESVNLGYEKPSTLEDFKVEYDAWIKRYESGEFSEENLMEIQKTLNEGKMLTEAQTKTFLDKQHPTPKATQRLFVDIVPRGTVWVQKDERIAQIHFQKKVNTKYKRAVELPESVRGGNGYGSTGAK